MPNDGTRIKIFIAFASQDETYLEQIVKFLSVLQAEIWHSGQLIPGFVVADTMAEQLAAADIILPVLSMDFLALNFEEKIEQHKKSDALIIPLVLRACPWLAGYYAQLRVLPADKKPVTRIVGDESNQDTQNIYFTEIAETLLGLVQTMRQPGFAVAQSGFSTGPGAENPLAAPAPASSDPSAVLYGEKLYLLCDRYPQTADFETITPELLDETNKKVRCFALAGDFPEQHSSLIERFLHQHILPAYKGKKTPIDNLVIPKYQMDTLEVGQLSVRRKLADAVMPEKGKGHELTALDILNAKTGYNVVVIQHNIMSSDWNKTTNELIKWYITDFWNVPFQKQHPQVFVFLNIILPEKTEGKGILSGLFGSKPDPIKQLDALARELQTGYYLLDQLQPVQGDDVRQWFLDYAHKLELDEDQIIQELYGQQTKQPMKKVENTLKTAIQKALKL